MSDTNGTPDVPALAEVVVTTKTVTYDGEEFTVAAETLDDVEVLEAWEDGKHTTMLRAILGPKQWTSFKSKKRGAVQVYELLDAILKTED